ncbi:MAG: HEPN domain-containing protein [Candidatus Hydrothermarchaeota archaeon]|nr:HEPN domain-containing protein [Candidatus Hydrothermarchaeota archaeon]
MEDVVSAELKLAEEFLQDAKLLFNNCSFRSAESRLYYSIFHAARALLLRKGFQPKTHKGTIALFGKEVIGKGMIEEKYAKLLSKTFSLREEADYLALATIDEIELEGLIKDAERFVDKMESLCAESI